MDIWTIIGFLIVLVIMSPFLLCLFGVAKLEEHMETFSDLYKFDSETQKSIDSYTAPTCVSLMAHLEELAAEVPTDKGTGRDLVYKIKRRLTLRHLAVLKADVPTSDTRVEISALEAFLTQIDTEHAKAVAQTA